MFEVPDGRFTVSAKLEITEKNRNLLFKYFTSVAGLS